MNIYIYIYIYYKERERVRGKEYRQTRTHVWAKSGPGSPNPPTLGLKCWITSGGDRVDRSIHPAGPQLDSHTKLIETCAHTHTYT